MEVGGDWYDATELADGKLALVIGDVVGHGVQAAAAMGQIRNALRAYAVEGHGPASALEHLNQLVQAVEEGEMTTLIYLLFDPATRLVRFASAGHPPPLVVDPRSRATYLEGGRWLPLGVSSKPGYAEADATLEPGSTVLLYTDGLIERRHATLEDGLERLVVAASEAHGDVGSFLDHIISALVGVEGLSDDVAMLALRLAPPDAGAPGAQACGRPDRRSPGFDEQLGPFPPADEARARRRHHEITVACGEAASNAIAHAGTDADAHFEVDARRSGGDIEIVVRDPLRPLEAGRRTSHRGFGLLLMETLMDSVEIRRGESGDRGMHAPQATRARAAVSAVAAPTIRLSGPQFCLIPQGRRCDDPRR